MCSAVVMLLIFPIIVECCLHMRETDADQNVEVLKGDACTRANGTDLWDSWSCAEQRECRCQVLVLDGARMAEVLKSDDDKKGQPAKRRSAKRRAGIVGIDEGKQRVE